MAAPSILITGCSSGIGLDAARGLRARGWRVFASCRAEADCARLRAEGFESPRLDYSDEASIAAALAEVLAATGGRLDALFNNGAYGLPALTEDLPRDALRAIFETNLFGYFDLIRRVLPVMRSQGSGRIVNCSSVLGLTGMPWRGAYVGTKFAMEGMSDVLRLELRGQPIHVVLIEPGPITTMIRQKARLQFERWIDWKSSFGRERYERTLIPRLYDDSNRRDPFELPPSAVTRVLVRALEARRPRPRYRVTWATSAMALARRLLTSRQLDRLAGRF
jgi:NAD(P)-dependent dehydrogenase (short-subunit alcohol dehydrogenase family)